MSRLSDQKLICLHIKYLTGVLTAHTTSQRLIRTHLRRRKAGKVSAATPQVATAGKGVNALCTHYHCIQCKLVFCYYNKKLRALCFRKFMGSISARNAINIQNHFHLTCAIFLNQSHSTKLNCCDKYS